ncbi:uncharacterized protein T551_00924 [Pneumocystis jirovecii RU7]|uniref:RRM domain-containing protein n=1 Tax=Pneumocystis jirovecii (strain RU7) TaxID=1408657 RepID=A0A0W4ZTF1_PNEJ7|nr:uncharacterized protein T551_00924 [Pneumocystis jirovecii RU7]KTW31663.1 hypothetical protein T551_00924 [Pneumocystis jirovecii RU7]
MLKNGKIEQISEDEKQGINKEKAQQEREQGFISLEEAEETVSDIGSEGASESESLSEAPSDLLSDICLETSLKDEEEAKEGEEDEMSQREVELEEETKESDAQEKCLNEESENQVSEVIQEKKELDNMVEPQVDIEEATEKDDEEKSEECDYKHSEVDTCMFSETVQATTQDNPLIADTLNPIPSSLDLQKLLATLSPALQTDPSLAAPLTTSNNPLSPNFIEALNTVSSTSDTTAVQPALTQQPKHKDAIDHDTPCTPQEDALFQKFLVDEKHIMSNTAPHEFPPGSRMFIGNLPTEKVTKKDVFRVFYPYGRLGQIALKQAYGFVQFFSSEECQNAINGEQGTMIRGRKMHLEVSKPQKHRPPLSSDKKAYRPRSRSPDVRDRSPVRGRNRSHGRGNHGYGSPYDRDKKDRYGPREEYGKRRSPPLSLRHPRDRDMDYPGDYRSISPDRYRDYPPRHQMDSFPLPRRYGNDVPECQIIITDDTDRSFIYFVEKVFKDKGFRIDTLFLSPRLSLPSVVQQMIIEGIMAIIFLSRQMQSQSKISMQIFDRRADSSDVKFDEYANIDVHVAVVLALRKKQSVLQLTNTYQPPNPGNLNTQPQNLALSASNSDLATLIGSLDPTTLQKVIGALTQPSQQLTPQLQSLSYTSLQMPHQGASINKGYPTNPTLSPMIKPSQQPDQQVQDILGQLAKLQGQQK